MKTNSMIPWEVSIGTHLIFSTDFEHYFHMPVRQKNGFIKYFGGHADDDVQDTFIWWERHCIHRPIVSSRTTIIFIYTVQAGSNLNILNEYPYMSDVCLFSVFCVFWCLIITKTCPCNTLQFFTAVKKIIFRRKIVMVFLFLIKTLIVGTR